MVRKVYTLQGAAQKSRFMWQMHKIARFGHIGRDGRVVQSGIGVWGFPGSVWEQVGIPLSCPQGRFLLDQTC